MAEDALMTPPIENLLSHVPKSFGFEAPAEQWMSMVRDAFADEALGRLGPYELVEAVGHGGQGTVYRARQPGTQRDIALKRLVAGAFASPGMRARFEREIEAASLLAHPNIVRVYGTEIIDGQTVLVMEWIDGVPIDRWADGGAEACEHAVSNGAPSAAGPQGAHARSITDRLRTFALVCDAVSHAHQRGVLHRDLKPPNVLVDAGGQPHVLDFGLAKVAQVHAAAGSRDALTQGQGFLGTPSYAAPEQIAGDMAQVDARSDVYALGAILFHMLTGTLPYGERRSLAEMLDAIRDQDPPRPSSLTRGALNAEIDAIALKALEKQPTRRYQSVDALASDVRRFLNNETVLAHPPSAAYQARKFVARHKATVAAAAGIVIALALGLVGVSVALLAAQSAQRKAEQSDLTAQQIKDFLNQTLASADPTVGRGYDTPMSAVLDEAAKRLEGGALADQPEAHAQVRTTLADTYMSLGLYAPALVQYQAAVDVRRRAFGDTSGDLADALLRLARMATRQEEFDRAEQAAQEAARINLTVFGPDDLRTIAAQQTLAAGWMTARRHDDATALLCELLPRAVAIAGSEPNEVVCEIKGTLGFAGGCSRTDEEGIRLLQETLIAQRAIYGQDHDRIARTLLNLGAQFSSARRPADAERSLIEALDMRRRLFGEGHPAIATVQFNLGNVYHTTKRYDQAIAMQRAALETQERRLPPAHWETVRTRMSLGRTLTAVDEHQEAEAHLRQAVADYLGKSTPVSVRANQARRYLADCLIRQRKFDEAELVLTDAWRDARSRFRGNAAVATVGVPEMFVRLYEAWGNAEAAATWKQQVQSAGHDEPMTSAPGG